LSMRIFELENRCTGNRTVGSNPTLSAKNSQSLRAHPAQSRTVHVCFGSEISANFALPIQRTRESKNSKH
ncbi:MAG: hypothetical protein WAN73_08215, partial [Methyloceanibacter sp.]